MKLFTDVKIGRRLGIGFGMINAIRQGVQKTVASMDTAKDKVTTGVALSSETSTALPGISSGR